MKLKFPESLLEKLLVSLDKNPEANGVMLTKDELISIYDELLEMRNSNCILINGKDRKLQFDGRWIEVEVV